MSGSLEAQRRMPARFSRIHDRIAALSLPVYCVVAGVSAVAGSLALGGVAFFVAEAFGLSITTDGRADAIGPAFVFTAIVLAPVVETLLLVVCLKLTAGLGRLGSCAASAFLWAVLHGLITPLGFFGTIWSFFVFGWGYLLWRRRSARHAFIAAAVPHAIVNVMVLGLLWIV